jgi:hypothetical protein
MSRASFLDRSPEVSLASAFAIWIRWWSKRKVKRNPLSFSAAVPCLPLRSTSRRAIPVWALSPAIAPHQRFQMNVPRGNGVHIETRATPRKATSTLVHFMQQLAPRASIEAEPRIVPALRRAKAICESSGKAPFHPYICLARRANCTHSAMTRGDGFLVRLSLSPRPVTHLSKANVK